MAPRAGEGSRRVMGKQIIQQPNGQFAIFSTGTDTVHVWDATAEEIEEHFVNRAADDERRRVREILAHVAAGNPSKAYYQFAMTWAEALEADEEHGGEVWLAERARAVTGDD